MLTFKLSRRGKKKQPTYRLVVVDKKKDPWGKVKEDVGSYNPHTKKTQFKVERIKFWISKGAQPSPSVHNILVKEKILEAPRKKIKIKIKKKPAVSNETMPKTEEKSATPVEEIISKAEKKPEEKKPIEKKERENSKEKSVEQEKPKVIPTEDSKNKEEKMVKKTTE